MRKITKEERSAAVAQLRSELHAGQEILVLTTKVSASGMSRNLRFFYCYTDGDDYRNEGGQLLGGHAQRTTPFVDRGRGKAGLRDITWFVVKSGALNAARGSRGDEATIGGCGMDMHFAAVDNLADHIGLPLRYRSL